MTAPAKTVKEVLIAARWIIANVGWIQGSFYRYQKYGPSNQYPTDYAPKRHWAVLNGCCTMGAIDLVETDVELRTQASALLSEEVKCSIACWNDNFCDDKEDVINVLNRLIKKLK